jgi:hypothetical protein
MRLSKKSKELMYFFTKNKNVNNIKQTKQTDILIKELYNDILHSYKYLNELKKRGNYFTFKMKKITNTKQIIKPMLFTSDSFPEKIRSHIDETVMTEIKYNFSLYGRQITLYFMVEDENVDLDSFHTYVDTIIMWLYILNKYASKKCSNTLTVYLYFTSLKKTLPKSNIDILDQIHVNTAFTTTCPKDSEIVVFRKEEWFKVFIHETFHNFGLDFSDMNNNTAHSCILEIFKVDSQVNLYETYTEFWAEIMNALFCGFFSIQDKTNLEEFLSYSEFFINLERTYSFFQLVKTLNFMGLTYKDLYSKTKASKIKRDNLYKEKSNVLAYYIMKTILMNNYQGFLIWCKTRNFSLIQFNKTDAIQKDFCRFIEENYKTSSMLKGVSHAHKFLMDIHKSKKYNKNDLDYILSNLRMSICELDL